MIPWPEVLETGYGDLDQDHRRLIEQCNSLTGLVRERGPWQEVVRGSHALAEAFSRHFHTEEGILERTNFPRVETHRQQHQRLEQQLKDLTGRLSSVDGSREEHWNLVGSLRETLLETLFRHDLDYKSHLEQVAGR